MSAGAFIDSRYQSNDGLIFPVRIQPETQAMNIDLAVNSPPTADAGAGLPTLVTRKSRKGFGVHPRYITVRLTADGAGVTADYLGEGTTHTVPILQQAMWDSIVKGDVGVYVGIACVVVSKSPEIVR